MRGRELKSFALPALLAGTSRQPIEFGRLLGGAISSADPASALKALGLTGQALRFEPPAPPADYAAIAQRKPSRRCVGDALRVKLVRLVGDGKQGAPPQDDLALGVALALERLRMQPHPFDFPRLDGFLRTHAERLGPDAYAWIDRDKGVEEKRGYFDLETLDDENWREATPARRQKYIEDRRRADADGGRALVESVWGSEGADMRLRLLQALRPGLSAADAPFLEGLATDRAPRVRELAERQLARLPAGAGQSLALKSVVERIARGQTGLLRKRPMLKLEAPANVGDGWRTWVAEAFAQVELDELGKALDLPPADMIAAAAEDQRLSVAMAIMAFRLPNLELARQAYEATAEASPWFEGQLLDSIENLGPAARCELVEFLLQKSLAAGAVASIALGRAPRLLDRSISDDLMDEILQAPAGPRWSAPVKQHHVGHLAQLAILSSRAKRPAVRAALASIDASNLAIRHIHQFLDLLDSLEQSEPS